MTETKRLPDENDLVIAHRDCFRQRGDVLRSQQCGCIHCIRIFPPVRIVAWTDDGQTALCPECGIDPVLGDASGHPMTTEFLQAMHARWFG